MHAPRLVIEPALANASRVLHSLYEDSVDAHWTLDTPPGGNAREEADGLTFCGNHLRLSLQRTAQKSKTIAALRARAAILGLDAPEVDAYVTLLARASTPGSLHDALANLPECHDDDGAAASSQPSSSCDAAVCVATQPTSFVAACAVAGNRWPSLRNKAIRGDEWHRLAVSARALGAARPERLLLASGISAELSAGADLLVDDLQIVSLRPPNRVSAHYFDGPPTPGASWAASVAEVTFPLSKRGGPGWCEYMSSDFRPGARQSPGRRQAPRCRMDGDHLRGRWVQNCDPSNGLLRTRPDHYAYGRAMPPVKGKFEFRVCYRTSFWERERALQALSWTWRPYDCRLEPFDAAAFDAWLGERTIVIVGDSLSAQLYYSFVLLLGDRVVAMAEHADGMRRSRPASDGVAGPAPPAAPPPPRCSTGVADEGPSAYSEAKLSRGGRVIKVLGHMRYIGELQRLERAPWAHLVRQADVLVLNVGHHYRTVDRTFAGYTEMVRHVESSLRDHLKPAARVVVRTTNVGHRGCENATRPLQDRKAAWERLAERPGGAFDWSPPSAEDASRLEAGRGNPNSAGSSRHDPFDWRAPALHEGAWARVFADSPVFRNRFSLLNLSFVDARSDGHVASAMRYSDESERKARWGGGLDCLHYCYPGPVDFWSLALFNLLTQFS